MAVVNIGWLHDLGIVVIVFGLGLFWRGLHGGRNGERGLVRRGVPMLERLEGWRLTLLGLTLTGIGAAWYWSALWLLILSLGIGYVELQEATKVIQAWRWGQGRGTTSPRSAGQLVSRSAPDAQSTMVASFQRQG